MIKVIDHTFDPNNVEKQDLFICTIGFEDRSTYLLRKLMNKVSSENIRVFCYKNLVDNNKDNNIDKKRITIFVNDLINKGIDVAYVEYKDADIVFNEIYSFIYSKKIGIRKIYIDYSAMPRTWYSKLPLGLHSLIEGIEYLYVVGKYEKGPEDYPCAGMEDLMPMIGNPSLNCNGGLHVLGIGYDSIRTMGIISRLDPASYCVCSARHSKNVTMEKLVRKVNKPIIDQAMFSVNFLMDDFSFMVAKLCEIAYEYSSLYDVSFVPDGPKPLIMAMALVPQIVNKDGVVCLLVSRNKKGYKPVNVKPTKDIISFSINETN